MAPAMEDLDSNIREPFGTVSEAVLLREGQLNEFRVASRNEGLHVGSGNLTLKRLAGLLLGRNACSTPS